MDVSDRHIFISVFLGATQIAQMVKALATKSKDLDSIPQTHIVGENSLLKAIHVPSHMQHGTC